jgi:iron complex outermembrane recepter protein
LRADVGVKYVQIGLPRVTGYNTAGVPDVSYDNVFDYTRTMTGMYAGSQTFKEWLPYAGFKYEINPQTSARLTYGRNYATPWAGPVYSTYYSNYAAFQKANISLQNLWDDMKLEVSDNVDLGFRYDRGSWYIAPTLFYGRFNNKQVPIYDSMVGVTYYQSGAQAESKGAEVEVGATVVSGLTLFGSLTYNSFVFTDNVRTASNTIISCKGKQVTDAPEYMAKIGASYTTKGFTITPIVRYIGERYGDVENKERIGAYTLVDLNLGYVLKQIWGFREVSFGLNFLNLFDERYISIIKVDQDATQSLSTTYYPGAPFTVIGSIGVKY